MKMKKPMVLRTVSLGMFVVAIIFIACALANPALGRTFYIGDIAIGAVVIGAAFFLAFELVICTGAILSKLDKKK